MFILGAVHIWTWIYHLYYSERWGLSDKSGSCQKVWELTPFYSTIM
jgi:hypothetical protein